MLKRTLIATALAVSFYGNAAAANDHVTIPGYSTDVPGIEQQHLSAQFWIKRADDAQQIILDSKQIQAFNDRSYTVQDELVRINELPKSYTAEQLKQKIDDISSLPSYPRFYANGERASAEQLQNYRDNANIAAVSADNPVRYALVTERAPMRTFPTFDKLYSEGMDLDIDRFQETGVFPGMALAILHTSADGKWYLAQSYNYLAWVPADRVAIGTKAEVIGYRQQHPYYVVTGNTEETVYTPNKPAVSQTQLDMSSRLPLLTAKQTGHNVNGQNPFAAYTVKLPIRGAGGKLEFSPALVPRSADMHVGHLPYTEANVINQAFKFLGERYGWGHDFNGRDCTGFVQEIYRTMGIDMPRNSGQQGYGEYGDTQLFDENSSNAEKRERLKQAKIGDLIYLPGHVVMYIGEIDGEPYVIHDVHGLSYEQADGSHYEGTLNGVSVTPLTELGFGKDKTYLDVIYSIKTVR
jgi:cell wall-associated NlpC family hydrolase